MFGFFNLNLIACWSLFQHSLNLELYFYTDSFKTDPQTKKIVEKRERKKSCLVNIVLKVHSLLGHKPNCKIRVIWKYFHINTFRKTGLNYSSICFLGKRIIWNYPTRCLLSQYIAPK